MKTYDQMYAHVQVSIVDILSRPQMWGSLDAVEKQALLLIELEVWLLNDNQDLSERFVIDKYNVFINKFINGSYSDTCFPLSIFLKNESHSYEKLVELLRQFRFQILEEIK